MLMQKVLTDNRAQRSERTPSVVWMSEMENNLGQQAWQFLFLSIYLPTLSPCCHSVPSIKNKPFSSSLAIPLMNVVWYRKHGILNLKGCVWVSSRLSAAVGVSRRCCYYACLRQNASIGRWQTWETARERAARMTDDPPSGSRQPCYSSRSHATLCDCSPMDLCPWHREAISLFICALSLLHTYSSSRHLPAGHWGGGKLHCQSIFSSDLMKAV